MRSITATCLAALLGASVALAQSSVDYEVAAVDDGGTVAGRVAFEGTVPAPRAFTITRDSNACGEGERLVDVVEVSADGGLMGVVVEIEGITFGKEWDPAALEAELDQEACVFTAPSWVVAKGRDLMIKNSDPVLHNVHAYELVGASGRRPAFNIAQPKQGQVTKQRIKLRRSNIVKLECDAHTFMHAHLYFASSPYYATSDADGNFEIGDVPPGTYAVTAWHPVLGRQEAEVTVASAESASVGFTFIDEK